MFRLYLIEGSPQTRSRGPLASKRIKTFGIAKTPKV
jgi:hypothetical protein